MPADTMISILAATLLATGWALWLLPIGRCQECPHCRAERLKVGVKLCFGDRHAVDIHRQDALAPPNEEDHRGFIRTGKTKTARR